MIGLISRIGLFTDYGSPITSYYSPMHLPTRNTRNTRPRVLILAGIALALFTWGFGIPLFHLWRYTPVEGDIAFQSLPHMDLVDAIEGVSGSPFSHCGVVMQRDGRWVVVESIGTVHETPLWQWMFRGRGNAFEIYRLKDASALDAAKLRSALAGFMGRPYDFHYAPDDEAIYCSELVCKAYDRGLGLKLGTPETLGSLNWKPFEEFIRSMEGGKLPLDREMVTPVSLTRSPLVQQVTHRF